MKKIAFVHDFLLYYGGAEGTLKRLADVYDDAPIFTLLANEEITKKYFSNKKVEESFLKKFPGFIKKRHKYLFPLMPTAIEAFNLRDYDVVVSSSSAFAKGIVVKPKTTHVCYMHAPMRYVWDYNSEYTSEQRLKGKAKIVTRFLLNYLRLWDRISAERVDVFVANSKYTAKRIKKYYRKTAEVIYPPVDTQKITPQKENKGYFLTVGRLSAYKRTKLIVQTFLKEGLPLVVVGRGDEFKELQRMTAGSKNVKILGWVSEENLIKLYQNSRAFVCASEDDFNITAVEAMAAGKPVIALGEGGVKETVVEGQTGEFFSQPTKDSLSGAIERFKQNENSYDPEKIRARAEEFSSEKFIEKMKKVIDDAKNKKE